METLSEIVGPILISAYDIAHPPPVSDMDVADALAQAGVTFVLLDSGGYEANWNARAESAGLIQKNSAPGWTRAEHLTQLESWPSAVPLLAVTFDTPDDPGGSLEEQIERAEELASSCPQHAIEILLKPAGRRFDLSELPLLAKFARRLDAFPALGVTEDEIGASMAERLQFLSALRRTLDDAGSDAPVHVFGGLDPLMTPLYFAAGADIFDGLTWLRYAFQDNVGIYDKSFVATEYPMALEEDEMWNMRLRNIRTLVDLQLSLTSFLKHRDFSVYGSAGERLAAAWQKCGVSD